ncbi:glycosyltransferase family protein [Marinobacterium lutimaris]|uniref:Predicted glycosyl transferase n=1 Tax=Marinobacterium lutimaris TaxID=568106 RepID=A0A1H6D7V5_9GAMM|nr:glycosyltransferase [Marinobacterium lutimaris]SEG81158.1 Predicted glycosyl transferase [Marinobacterium lutimaris]
MKWPVDKPAPTLMFYVQHLLGVGHIKRASLLVKGWLEAGFDVCVVSGGEPVPLFNFDGAQLVQLPPVKTADAAFSALVTAEGEPLDDGFREHRKGILLDTFAAVQPDILVIENYPFGRRQLRWELKPLLELASNAEKRPLIACSVRDIVQARKAERVAETVSLIERYFDLVLVHGDGRFVPFESSFPAAAEIAEKIRYTGYVTDSIAASDAEDGEAEGEGEVLVSSGGGAVGFGLMRAAMDGRSQTLLAEHTWRFLMGPNVPTHERAELELGVKPGVIVEPSRPDFPALLTRCGLSISQGGYNTVMDLLVARAPAVIVPFEGEGETEQLERTSKLAQFGLCALVRERDLTPEAMAQAVDRAVALHPEQVDIDLQGAAHCARLLGEALESRKTVKPENKLETLGG